MLVSLKCPFKTDFLYEVSAGPSRTLEVTCMLPFGGSKDEGYSRAGEPHGTVTYSRETDVILPVCLAHYLSLLGMPTLVTCSSRTLPQCVSHPAKE